MLLLLLNGISQISRVRFLGFGTARDGNRGMGESSTSPILLRAVLVANGERHFALPGPGNDRTVYRFLQFICAPPRQANKNRPAQQIARGFAMNRDRLKDYS
jgi:hypothetical protein